MQQAFADYLYWQKTKIGRDINPSKCDQLLVEAGAKRTDISEASSTFEFVVVNPQSVADAHQSDAYLYGPGGRIRKES